MVDSLAEFAVVTCLYSVFAKGVNLLAIKCSLLLQYLSLRRPPPARCKPIVNSSELKLKGDTSGVT